MFCISGFSGTGKDEAARLLVEKYGAVQTGLADPAKRHMADVYGFTEHQLFGPSSARNAGDVRYPKQIALDYFIRQISRSEIMERSSSPHLVGKLNIEDKYWTYTTSKGVLHGPQGPARPYIFKPGDTAFHVFVKEGDPEFWLSPREALQKYCETMNNAYLFTWIDKGIADHLRLAETEDWSGCSKQHVTRFNYSKMKGVVSVPRWIPDGMPIITCFADFRHKHEISTIRRLRQDNRNVTPVLIRVRRPSVPNPPFDHRSETEQVQIPDEDFDFIIYNDASVADLHEKIDDIVRKVAGI